MIDHAGDAAPCPYCGAAQDGAAGGFEPPVAGDLAVCSTCLALSVFTGTGLERRRATSVEELENTTEVQRVRRLIRGIRGR